MSDPDFVRRLKDIHRRLTHQRRFGVDSLPAYRHAAVQAEGDIEELLIDYGFQRSDEREQSRSIAIVETDAP